MVGVARGGRIDGSTALNARGDERSSVIARKARAVELRISVKYSYWVRRGGKGVVDLPANHGSNCVKRPCINSSNGAARSQLFVFGTSRKYAPTLVVGIGA